MRIPHPGGGWIAAQLAAADGALSGEISLPAGVGGTLVWRGRQRRLRPGRQRVALTR